MPSVLITGAGRGIGRVSALRLANAGWEVFAGVGRGEDGRSPITDAGSGRVTPLALDVTDASDLGGLADSLPKQLDAVVNNAGIVVGGPVEAIALDELRRQLEVNLVGQLAVTQAVLPRIRDSRGRIVFVSSVSGWVSTPWTGAYNASKFALEGLTDALRIELRPWGIKVILVQPNSTDTDIWRKALDQLEQTEAGLTDAHRRLYSRHIAGMRRTTKLVQKTAVPPGASRPRSSAPCPPRGPRHAIRWVWHQGSSSHRAA